MCMPDAGMQWRESLHLACTMVCQYTSLCVPVFYDTSHPAGIMSHRSGMHLRTAASHKRTFTADRAMAGVPDPRRHPTSLPRPTLRARRQADSVMHIVQLSHLILQASVCHTYCTAITPHSTCLFFQHVAPSPVPLQPPGAPHPGGPAPRQ